MKTDIFIKISRAVILLVYAAESCSGVIRSFIRCFQDPSNSVVELKRQLPSTKRQQLIETFVELKTGYQNGIQDIIATVDTLFSSWGTLPKESGKYSNIQPKLSRPSIWYYHGSIRNPLVRLISLKRNGSVIFAIVTHNNFMFRYFDYRLGTSLPTL